MRKKLSQKLLTGAVSVAIILTATLSPVFADAFKKGTTPTLPSSDESIGEAITTQSDVLKAVSPRMSTEAVTYTVGGETSDFPATAAGLQAAFATNANDYIIKLMDNIDLGSTQVLHDTNQAVTLDLNGHEVKITNTDEDNPISAVSVENGMDLIVKDSSVAESGKIIANGKGCIAISISGYVNDQPVGNLTVNGGTIVGGIYNGGNTVDIAGGNIYSGNESENEYAIFNSFGSVIISGGVVKNSSKNGYGIYNEQLGSTTTINGGTVSVSGSDSVGIFSLGGDKIIVNGGKIIAKNNSNGIKIQHGSATINGGTITADTGYAVADFTYDPNSDNFEDGNNITIVGGNVSEIGIALSEPDLTNEGKYASKFTAKNSNGAEIKLCELSGMDADAKIAQLTTVPSYSYGIKDTFTDSSGKMFIWLPTSVVSGRNLINVTVVAGDKTYTGTIVNGNAVMKRVVEGQYNVTVVGGTSNIASAKSGDTIKINANVPSGKIFKEWRVTPAVAFVNGTSKISKTAEFTMPSSDVAVEAVFANNSTDSTGGSYYSGGSSTYSDYTAYVVSGNGQTIEKNSGLSAKFTIDMPYISFIYLEADKETLINGVDYTVSDGSIVLNLNPAYLNTLSVGKHKVRAEITGGYAELSFEIVEKSDTPEKPIASTVITGITQNPQTGDNWLKALLF